MKKGLSLVEMIIAIGILGLILTAVSTIFMVGIKNYRVESLRGFLQKEINFTTDDLGNNVKLASSSPETYSTYTRDNALILALPSTDASQEFIYSGSTLEQDHVIYYLNGTDLYKKIEPSALSSRQYRDSKILEDVTSFSCNYFPLASTSQIECSLGITKAVGNTTIRLEQTKKANLRNKNA